MENELRIQKIIKNILEIRFKCNILLIESWDDFLEAELLYLGYKTQEQEINSFNKFRDYENVYCLKIDGSKFLIKNIKLYSSIEETNYFKAKVDYQ